jgi:hypothetical protein
MFYSAVSSETAAKGSMQYDKGTGMAAEAQYPKIWSLLLFFIPFL